MIIQRLLALIDNLLQGLIIQQQSVDPHLDQNTYLLTAVSAIKSFDHYLPISDGLIPILGVYIAYGVALVAFRVVLIIVNVLRGSGAK